MQTMTNEMPGQRARIAFIPWTVPVIGYVLVAASGLASAQIAFQALPSMATGPAPIAIAAGDFDGDNKLDLAVVMKGNNDVYIYTGNGDGTFQYAGFRVVGTTPWAIVDGDFNQDGNLDLAIANSGSGNVSILLGNGNATFQPAVAYAVGDGPVSIAVDSFDPDGYADLVIANSGNVCAPPFAACGTVSMLRNNGDGTFHAGVTLYPQFIPAKVATGSFHGSDSDIVVTGASVDEFLVYLGDGGGGFPVVKGPYTVASADAVVAADFNGDGHADLAISRFVYGDISLQLGNGDGTFNTAGIYSEGALDSAPDAVVSADFDGDGHPDLAVANVNDNSVAVLRDRTVGNGGFWGAITLTGGLSQPTALAIGDFNSDGKPDLVVVNNAGDSLAVFLNTSAVDVIFANGFD